MKINIYFIRYCQPSHYIYNLQWQWWLCVFGMDRIVKALLCYVLMMAMVWCSNGAISGAAATLRVCVCAYRHRHRPKISFAFQIFCQQTIAYLFRCVFLRLHSHRRPLLLFLLFGIISLIQARKIKYIKIGFITVSQCICVDFICPLLIHSRYFKQMAMLFFAHYVGLVLVQSIRILSGLSRYHSLSLCDFVSVFFFFTFTVH